MAKKAPIAQQSFLEQSVRWITVSIFTVLPLLYFSGRIASYVTSKQYFFIGTVDVLVVLWTWLLLNDTRYRLTKKNLLLLLPLFLLLVSLTVSALVGVDPATSFFSTVETGTGLVFLYHCFLFACITASQIRVQHWQLLKSIFQAVLFSATMLAMMTFFTGGNGVFTTQSAMLNGSSGGAMMGNSLLAGAYFIFAVFMAIILLVREQVVYKKILYVIGLATIALSPIYFNAAIWKGAEISSSYFFIGEARIATVSLGIGVVLALLIWLCTKKENITMRIVGVAGLVLMVIVGGVVAERIVTRSSPLHAFFVKESGNRTIDWRVSIKGVQEKPLLGWGPENFHVVYQKYFDPAVFNPGRGNEAWALHPHNNTFEVLVDGGIIGGVLYLIVIATLFVAVFRLYRRERIDGKTCAALIGILAAFIIQQQMIYDSIVSYTMFFFIIAVVAGLSDTFSVEGMNKRPAITDRDVYYLIGVTVTAIMIPVWIYLAYLPARKVEEFQRVADMTSDMRAGAYEHLFHSAGSYAINTDIEFFADPLFFSYQGQKEQLKANSLYQNIAATELETFLTTVYPIWQHKQYDYHLTLSLIQLSNLQYYLTDDAASLQHVDEYIERAVALSPTDPQIYFEYAQVLVYQKHVAGAKTMIDKALALNPNYKPAVVFKSQLR